MTAADFNAICQAYGVAPAVALESEAVQEAARKGDVTELRRILAEEF